ncbi:hypothetical protein FN846DRAFT_579697 [Sphaerosporella brunnea]|uniref:Uncharacterized protein n=1 Tax=Sphaerosporella brunnea TaxID=1250544 RepID=A0A5J5F218_9PEZI|nr:hypothetical protein FN846DRAFT_579697 [Sphaerosporella brunnea]
MRVLSICVSAADYPSSTLHTPNPRARVAAHAESCAEPLCFDGRHLNAPHFTLNAPNPPPPPNPASRTTLSPVQSLYVRQIIYLIFYPLCDTTHTLRPCIYARKMSSTRSTSEYCGENEVLGENSPPSPPPHAFYIPSSRFLPSSRSPSTPALFTTPPYDGYLAEPRNSDLCVLSICVSLTDYPPYALSPPSPHSVVSTTLRSPPPCARVLSIRISGMPILPQLC